jgi:hypothetical protein
MQNESPDMTVVLGVTNDDGSVKQAVKTYTINTITRVWFTENASTLIDYGLGTGNQQYYYIEVTNDGKWWIDEMQLESEAPREIPGVFARTNGARSFSSSDSTQLTSRKVCSNCRERILSKSERFGRTDESPVDEPVETWAQEI